MTGQENMHPEPMPQEASGNPTGLRLQYVSDRFELRKQELLDSGLQEYIDQVDFYTAENVFYLPEECRWTYIMENAKQPNISRQDCAERLQPRAQQIHRVPQPRRAGGLRCQDARAARRPSRPAATGGREHQRVERIV